MINDRTSTSHTASIALPKTIAVAVGSLVACVLTYLALVRTPAGQRVEDAVLSDAHAALDTAPNGGLADWATALSGLRLVSAQVLFVVGVVLVALIGLARRQVALGAAAVAVIGSSVAAANLLKAEVLARPLLNPGNEWGATDNSFPSGHAALAVSVALALLLVVPHRVRPIVAGGGSVWSGAVAVTAVTHGWHRPSDVIGAALLALASFCLAVAILAARQGRATTEVRFTPAFLSAVPLCLVAAGWLTTQQAVRTVDAAALLAAGAGILPLLVAWWLLRSVELTRTSR